MSSRRESIGSSEKGEAAEASLQSADLASERQELAELLGQLLAWYWLDQTVNDPDRVDGSTGVDTIEVGSSRRATELRRHGDRHGRQEEQTSQCRKEGG